MSVFTVNNLLDIIQCELEYNRNFAILCVVSVGLPDIDEFVTETSEMLQTHRSHVSCIETCSYVFTVL